MYFTLIISFSIHNSLIQSCSYISYFRDKETEKDEDHQQFVKPGFELHKFNAISFFNHCGIPLAFKLGEYPSVKVWDLKTKGNDEVNLSLLRNQSNGNGHKLVKEYGDWGKKGGRERKAYSSVHPQKITSLFFIQLLQIANCGGLKYVHKFFDPL